MLDIPPASVAQRAWLIDEVVRNILAHVPSVGSTKTLASCARVSSALSEPALDMLWSRMTGLSPLCELLPASTQENNPPAHPAETTDTVPHSVITDADWSRFSRYARRVRKLHYHCREGPSERLSQRTFAALVRRAARAGAPLLPRLEELSWLQCARDISPYLHFLSPSLRRVTVYVQVGPVPPPSPSPPPEEHAGGGFFELLDAQSPDVEELSLEGIELPASLEPLRAFSRLRSLHLGAVAAPVAVILSYCGAMPTLSSLAVDLTRSPAAASSSPAAAAAAARSPLIDVDVPALSALEVLRVAGAPSLIEELLRAVRAESLRSASLAIAVPEHDPDGGARCAGVLSARFASSLRTVRVQYKLSATRVPPAGAAHPFAHHVRPLLRIRGLRECTLAVEDRGAPVAMADADVCAMAEAWPALTALEVALHSNPPAVAAEATLPSVAALGAFARHCPGLAHLRIPVSQDISALPEPSDARASAEMGASGRTARHGLRELWLSGVWFSQEESARVVAFLRGTFPDADLRAMVGVGVLGYSSC